MQIATLGECRFPSPMLRAVDDAARVPLDLVRMPGETPGDVEFELAGPRGRLYFHPERTTAGIVTCGGLCPGLNNVIRSLFLEMHHIYGVKKVLGFKGGYGGLDPANGIEPLELTCECVDTIHRSGGTILGTSRGPVDIGGHMNAQTLQADASTACTFGIAGLSVVADRLSAIRHARVKVVPDATGLVLDYLADGDFPRFGNNDNRVDQIAAAVSGARSRSRDPAAARRSGALTGPAG